MSGLMAFRLTLGPRADEPTMLCVSGIAVAGEMVALTGAAILDLIKFDVAWVITSDGTNIVPPPNENVMASPAATRPIRTPIAPAAAARSILRLIAQTPRSINAILPAGLAR